MLWQLDNTNLSLLGSVHVFDQPKPSLSKSMEQAYLTAKRVVFEVRLDERADGSAGLFPDGQCLSDSISAELFSDTRRLWLKIGFPEDQLERCRPWFAAFRLIFAMLPLAGLKVEWGIDRYFWNRAVKDNRAIGALERISDGQIIFNAAPAHEQEIFLAEVVQRFRGGYAHVMQMIAGWKSRQIEPFAAVLDYSLKRMPQLETELILGRNKRWMPRLIELSRDNVPTLIIAGGLHFAEPGSVQSLFAEQGHTVSAVTIGACICQ